MRAIRIWDLESGKCVRTLEGREGHTEVVNSVAVSPDGSTVVSGSEDNMVK